MNFLKKENRDFSIKRIVFGLSIISAISAFLWFILYSFNYENKSYSNKDNIILDYNYRHPRHYLNPPSADSFNILSFDRDVLSLNEPNNFLGTALNLFQIHNITLTESDESYDIEIRMPGISQKDINISLENGILNILYNQFFYNASNQKKHNYQNYYHKVKLPHGCSEDQIRSVYQNGILSIIIIKSKINNYEKATEIKINAS